MSPVLTTFVFEIVNFLLLVSLVSWLFFRPVRAALQARQDAEKRRREELDARHADFDQQRRELEERRRTFDVDTARMREALLATTSQEAAAIRAQASEAAQRERESVERTMAQLEQAQIEHLSSAVAVVARDTVVHLLTALDGSDLETSLVTAAARRVTTFDSNGLGIVLVESAHALDDRHRNVFLAALNGQSVDFRVVPDLGEGVRVVTARGLIDASTRGIARQAEQALKDALAYRLTETAV